MLIKNANVYITDKKKFEQCDISVRDGKFADIRNAGEIEAHGEDVIDYTGKYIVPGFVDIHTHGALGVDMIYADSKKLGEMSEYYLNHGVTTVFPTTISTTHENILNMIREVKKAKCDNNTRTANFEGVHVEGPYINKAKAGAHALNMIKMPDMRELDDIIAETINCGLKLHITVAPELEGASDFIIKAISSGATISIGHTEASGEELEKAVQLGAVSYTHLFNAMTPVHHRNAGVAGNALIGGTFVEVISDGVHLCKEIVQLIYKIKGCEKIILVSDSMAAAGLPDGEYGFESKTITVQGGRATIKGTDTIASSTTNLYFELLNFMQFTGESIENALLTVTKNPCKAVGIYDKKGSVDISKDADFVVLTEDYKIGAVYLNGELV